MSIEQRRATQLKRRKISKLQKIIKNKGAEFKRRDGILTRSRFLILAAGRLGITESSLIESLFTSGHGLLSYREVRDILSKDLALGSIRFTLPRKGSRGGGTYTSL